MQNDLCGRIVLFFSSQSTPESIQQAIEQIKELQAEIESVVKQPETGADKTGAAASAG